MNIRIHNDIWKVKLTDGSKKKMTPDAEHYNLGLCEYDKQVINIRSGLSFMNWYTLFNFPMVIKWKVKNRCVISLVFMVMEL